MSSAGTHDAQSGAGSRQVRLACTTELVGVGSLALGSLRHPAPDAEVLRFVCPRCNQRHESILLS